jgi:hypothetical protein
MKSPLARLELDRRRFVKGLGALGAAAWSLSPARAFALPEDKIKVVHYFTTPGDAQGRQGQPMVNQSANVVMIETERGLVGIGEGGEPRTMDECASMLIGLEVAGRKIAKLHRAVLDRLPISWRNAGRRGARLRSSRLPHVSIRHGQPARPRGGPF